MDVMLFVCGEPIVQRRSPLFGRNWLGNCWNISIVMSSAVFLLDFMKIECLEISTGIDDGYLYEFLEQHCVNFLYFLT